MSEHNEDRDRILNWFHSRYTQPVNSLPYDGKEGGYQYCGNGPYDARDMLRAKFGGSVPRDVIEEVADERDSESDDWTDFGVVPR